MNRGDIISELKLVRNKLKKDIEDQKLKISQIQIKLDETKALIKKLYEEIP